MAAGMTLGFTSLDPFQMQVLANILPEDVECASPVTRTAQTQKLALDQGYAERVLPVISGYVFGSAKHGPCKCLPKFLNPTNEHYLLVTLLLANAAANEALPIFLDRLVPGWAAILLSVTVVLIFGEIIPSAIFTGPSQLQLAAAMSPLVCSVKVLLMPIVWPIALILDWCMGHGEEERTRHELRGLVRTLRVLEADEANILQGVLDMHRKTARDIGVTLSRARMLPDDLVIDASCIEELQRWGHSRLFVYRRDPDDSSARDDVVGVLLVKKLVGINLAEGTRVGQLTWALKEPVVLNADDNLLTVLNKFQQGQCHLALICTPAHAREAGGAQGAGCVRLPQLQQQARPSMFCSLEDVIEAMLKEEIYDEEDIELGRDKSQSAIVTRWTRRSTASWSPGLLRGFPNHGERGNRPGGSFLCSGDSEDSGTSVLSEISEGQGSTADE